ncbi:hypothetical protein FACS1894125_0310 [Actinomycetota bacterium]|nr:hypothetical protein FACS1894125_0310 [Actinomycetota bacterium]
MPKITIIVPVYNGSKYLRRALGSILEQTIAREKLKVLVIDDGSTDSSNSIAQSFVNSHPYTFELITQKNQGTAKTRNKGISKVQTKYTAFLDQDDWFDKDYLEKLYDAAQKTGADVVACGFRRALGASQEGDNDGEVVQKPRYTRKTKNNLWYPYTHLEAWAKLHRTDFIQAVGATFFNNPFGEDIPFSVAENLHAHFEVIDYVGYNWFDNPTSVSATVHKEFADIKLDRLLRKLKKFRTVPPLSSLRTASPAQRLDDLTPNDILLEYYTAVVATYAVLHSSVNAKKPQFIANASAAISTLLKLFPDLEQNPYLKKRPTGCPLKTSQAVKLLLNAYNSDNLGKFYLLYRFPLVNFVERK